MRGNATENQILHDAITALQAALGVQAQILPFPEMQPGLRADALLEMVLQGQEHIFVAEVKAIDRRVVIGQIRA